MYERHKYVEDISRIESLNSPAATRKYDGANYFMKINESSTPSFISRRESVKGGFPDRTSKLPHLASIELPEYKNYVFNVELIHTGKDKESMESHPMVSGILNSLPDRAVEQQSIHGPIRAVLFDVIHPKIPTYEEKLRILKEVQRKAGKPELLFVPEIKIGKDDIHKFIKDTHSQMAEGIIVTDLNKLELENPRIKIKHTRTANLRIRGLVQEVDKTGKPKESTGAYELVDSTGRYVGNVGSGITREERIQSWKHKSSYIGKVVQVKFRTVTGNGMLREPVYNGEADGNCDKI